MLAFVLVMGCVGFVVYKVGKAAAKHPETTLGVGQVLFKMLRK